MHTQAPVAKPSSAHPSRRAGNAYARMMPMAMQKRARLQSTRNVGASRKLYSGNIDEEETKAVTSAHGHANSFSQSYLLDQSRRYLGQGATASELANSHEMSLKAIANLIDGLATNPDELKQSLA